MSTEYDKCFQVLPDKGASRHLIMTEDPNLALTLDILVNKGVLVGQGEMLTQDVIYYLNPEKIEPLAKYQREWTVPTPQERLKRPVEKPAGINRVYG